MPARDCGARPQGSQPGQGSATALRFAGPRKVGLVPFSDVIKFVAQSRLETRTLFPRAPCCGRHLPSCLRQSTKLLEEFLGELFPHEGELES